MEYRDRLLSKLEVLDQKLNELFEDLGQYSEEELNKQPASDVWSPMQLLNHLLLSEKLSLAYCQKKLSFEPKLKKRNVRTWINDQLLSFYLYTPITFKAPPMVSSESFPAEDSLENVKLHWLELRQKLRDFLAKIPAKYVEAEVYKHPFGMRLSLGGMLAFYKAHFHRHRKQLYQRLPKN